jgi:hypothetical protein
MGVPEACPNCGKILYRVAQMRPAPAFSWPARGVFASGFLIVVLTCWALLAAVPAGARISFRGLGILLVLVGLVIMLPFALLAYRLPKVLNLHCYRCGWRQRVIMDRRPTRQAIETAEDPYEEFAD